MDKILMSINHGDNWLPRERRQTADCEGCRWTLSFLRSRILCNLCLDCSCRPLALTLHAHVVIWTRSHKPVKLISEGLGETKTTPASKLTSTQSLTVHSLQTDITDKILMSISHGDYWLPREMRQIARVADGPLPPWEVGSFATFALTARVAPLCRRYMCMSS
jgi:hypothetical protein